MKRTLTIGAGIAYATIFGFSFLVTKDALDVLDPMELIFARFLLAALVMTALVVARVVKVDFRGKRLGLLLSMCVFQPILYFIFETYGVRESATSTAGIILGALPAFVAILGVVILGERTTRSQSLGLSLSVAGVIMVVLSGPGALAGGGSLRGALFLIGSMLSAALFNVLSRKASRNFTDVERTFAMMWVGALAFGLITLAKTLSVGNAGVGAPALPTRALSAWRAIVYLGILSSIVAFFCMNYTLTRLKASQSAVFANLVTVITVAAGVTLRGEPFDLPQALGAVVIIAGVWIANRQPKGLKTLPS